MRHEPQSIACCGIAKSAGKTVPALTVSHLRMLLEMVFPMETTCDREVHKQYLRHLQHAEGRLRGMHTAQAGDLVAHLGSYNGRRFFRKHLSRFFHVCVASTIGFQVENTVVWGRRMPVSPERWTVR